MLFYIRDIIWLLHSTVSSSVRERDFRNIGCTIGYNDFNNLDMQTLWWLPSKILRHIHKKRFTVFLSRFLRICNQSLQKVIKRAKKKFLFKKSICVSKNAEKVLKKCTIKKLLAKMWREKVLFSPFTHVRQTFFGYNFFCAFFYNYFNGFEISVKFCVFWYLFWFFSKNICLGSFITFFKLWSRTRKKRLKKSKNVLGNVS